MHLLQDEPERRGRGRMLAATGACALALIGGGLRGATALEATVAKRATRVSMRVLRLPSPPPSRKAKPVPPAEPDRRPVPAVKAPRPARRKPAAPKLAEPVPEPRPQSVADAPTQPVRLGLSLSSMGRGSGGPAFAVGDPVHGIPGGRAPGPIRPATPAPETTLQPESAPKVRAGAAIRNEAKLRRRITPAYPSTARKLGIEGVVVIALTITADGHVEEARLLRGVGHGLDAAALAASRKTTWSPATVDGRPVRSQRRFNVRFSLDG